MKKTTNTPHTPNIQEEYYDHERFLVARDKIIGKSHNDKGIGTLSEKTVHAVLKNYLEPDEDNHEVAINGYIADIFNDTGIIEVQTRQLNKLRDKLAVFLNDYTVTVVHPMPYNKWLSWVDPESGETGSLRRSPRHFNIYDSFYELYKIKAYLKNPNLKIWLVLMDVEEYKLLNGWSRDKKRGATRYDRIPLGIRRIVKLECIEDYMQFIPESLESYEDGFTVKDFAKEAHIHNDTAGSCLAMLYYLEQVDRVGKRGRAYVYKINEQW